MERVTALRQGWRDMADDSTDEGQQVTYVLDDGSGGISKHQGGIRLVEVSHPGISSKEFVARLGTTDNQKLVDLAYQTGKITTWDEGGSKLEGGPEGPVEELVPDRQESMSQKEFEAEMEKNTGYRF